MEVLIRGALQIFSNAKREGRDEGGREGGRDKGGRER